MKKNIVQAFREESKGTLYSPALDRDSCGVGFVADIKGRKSRSIIEMGLEVLRNIEHRGAVGADPRTGDGAGILMQIPHAFFKRSCADIGIRIPDAGEYAIGFLFMPQDKLIRHQIQKDVENLTVQEGYEFLGWRHVPVDTNVPGRVAQMNMPYMRQIIIRPKFSTRNQEELERKLYLLRRVYEKSIEGKYQITKDDFYIASLSSRTIVYKGMLMAEQLEDFYPDLKAKDMDSAMAMVHMRFSTNTLPTWDLAQPFRFIAHNGEINTIRGNRIWIQAREPQMESAYFGADLSRITPVIAENDSDSASFDRVLELLIRNGRSISHAMMMMVPEAWSKNRLMKPARRAFYEFHATMIEPWDGPAALAFSDGTMIGATLDRNGLRPARYIITKDDVCIMASEAGVLPVEASDIAVSSRLLPGKMLLIDFERGRIIRDEVLKKAICKKQPYRQWLAGNLLRLDNLPEPEFVHPPRHENILEQQKLFGYTREDLVMMMAPMASDGKEPVGSMGVDSALAVLSDRPQLLFRYFKQSFAQVTNPPIDPIREEAVMELTTYVGPEGNLLVEEPDDARRIELDQPILSNTDLEKLRTLSKGAFKGTTINTVFQITNPANLQKRIDEIRETVVDLARDGYTFLILSDRNVGRNKAPIPSLLAVSAVHQALIKAGLRSRVGLVVESGEPREVAHFAMLVGFGANAINPYLAFDTLADMVREGSIPGVTTFQQARENFIHAVEAGLLKVMSKMGISTLQSYLGGLLYEAVGINQAVVLEYFNGVSSQVGGVDLETLGEEAIRRHNSAFDLTHYPGTLETGSHHHYRKFGEEHIFSPMVIHKLQMATQKNDYNEYKSFSALVHRKASEQLYIRACLDWEKARTPVSVQEVESVESIMHRFQTGAMSFGSISTEAHSNLAIAMNRIGGKSNTGEGGEDPIRFVKLPNGDSARSAIKQVASGRFGVTCEYLVNADDIQIKMAQGAKPGEGGQLPGHKVDNVIARLRHSTPGVTLISPPPHHDIYSIEDLQQLIFDLKNVNPRARISVKLVSETGVGTVAAGVAKAHADHILISGHDGGTGASPISSLHYAGTPWELGLAEAHQALMANGLRDRVYLGVDGKMLTGRDVLIAAMLGAEEFGFSTSALITQGCIMMRKCHLNTCPVGVATQDPRLRAKFSGQPEYLVHYMTFIATEVRELLAGMGVRSLDEIIGHSEKLSQVHIDHWKARSLNLAPLLKKPGSLIPTERRRIREQDHGINRQLDLEFIRQAEPVFTGGGTVHIRSAVRNLDRSVGAMLSGEISRRLGDHALADDTIRIELEGVAGQSFGAFLNKGVTMSLKGMANDYVGKGLCGGKLIVTIPPGAGYKASDNIVVGNTVLYGATSGEAYLNGVAGERFAVRNSGACAVVEGVGDHGLEYMTGGRIVVLGTTGLNFAAGMSGGIAYVYDPDESFAGKLNTEMVDLEAVDAEEDIAGLQRLIQNHVQYTNSSRGKAILENFRKELRRFHKVIPRDYRAAMQRLSAQAEESQLKVAVNG